jgi:hypothetical protein
VCVTVFLSGITWILTANTRRKLSFRAVGGQLWGNGTSLGRYISERAAQTDSPVDALQDYHSQITEYFTANMQPLLVPYPLTKWPLWLPAALAEFKPTCNTGDELVALIENPEPTWGDWYALALRYGELQVQSPLSARTVNTFEAPPLPEVSVPVDVSNGLDAACANLIAVCGRF